jgi:DNA-binding NtrC family response regulator
MPPQSAAQRAQRILVVDDDTSILALCCRKLEEAGFAVLQAPGSSEALTLCSEPHGRIDLFLIDLLLPPSGLQLASSTSPMPRVHGQELAQRIRALKPDTRMVHGVQRDEGLLFLKKPFNGDQLVGIVKKALAGPPATLKEPEGQTRRGDKNEVDWFD